MWAPGRSWSCLAAKLSRCKEGMARVFAVRATSYLDNTSVVVQSGLKVAKLSWCFRTVSVAKRSVAVGLVSEPENCHGCSTLIASSERIRVQLSLRICQASRALRVLGYKVDKWTKNFTGAGHRQKKKEFGLINHCGFCSAGVYLT